MPQLVVLDVDGTLTKVRSSWQYLHERLGIWEGKADAYQKMFQSHQITYQEFCYLDALLWEGIPLGDVLQIIEEIEYREMADRFFHLLSDGERKFALVSTGLGFLVEKVKDDFGLHFAYSNHLEDDGQYLTGEVRVDVGWEDKPKIVRKLQKDLSISKEDVAVLGDSDGDLGMFDAAGYRIAVSPLSERLREKADEVLEDGDLERGASSLLQWKKAKCTKT